MHARIEAHWLRNGGFVAAGARVLIGPTAGFSPLCGGRIRMARSTHWLKTAGCVAAGAGVVTAPVAGAVALVAADIVGTATPAAAGVWLQKGCGTGYYITDCVSRSYRPNSPSPYRGKAHTIINGFADYGHVELNVNGSVYNTPNRWYSPSWRYSPYTGAYKESHNPVCVMFWSTGPPGTIGSGVYSLSAKKCGSW